MDKLGFLLDTPQHSPTSLAIPYALVYFIDASWFAASSMIAHVRLLPPIDIPRRNELAAAYPCSINASRNCQSRLGRNRCRAIEIQAVGLIHTARGLWLEK